MRNKQVGVKSRNPFVIRSLLRMLSEGSVLQTNKTVLSQSLRYQVTPSDSERSSKGSLKTCWSQSLRYQVTPSDRQGFHMAKYDRTLKRRNPFVIRSLLRIRASRRNRNQARSSQSLRYQVTPSDTKPWNDPFYSNDPFARRNPFVIRSLLRMSCCSLEGWAITRSCRNPFVIRSLLRIDTSL